jgi:hypothetical protein
MPQIHGILAGMAAAASDPGRPSGSILQENRGFPTPILNGWVGCLLNVWFTKPERTPVLGTGAMEAGAAHPQGLVRREFALAQQAHSPIAS